MSEPHVVIVTGMSGAGRSQAANVLEDVGYFVVDNLPTSLIEAVVDQVGVLEGARSKVAVVVDTRGGVTLEALDSAVTGLMGRGVRVTVLYLDADDATLIRRYEETRRPHPVEEGPLGERIRTERVGFEEIRGEADFIIDTSELNVHQLRQQIEAAFAGEQPERRMRVDVISFGFKRGVPRVVDLLFDVRFLPNPHWVPELRPQTGCDSDVSDYVLGQPDAGEFIDRTSELLAFLVPRYEAEGKSYLTIGVGCTGGRHRSVAIAEDLAERLSGGPIDVNVVHRDLPHGVVDH
jgi:UPF0042 nucleotide-binding protein